MDGALLQDRLSRGMGAAARAFGMPNDLFRPRGTDNPVKPEKAVLRLAAAFDGGDPGYRRPRGYDRALRGTFDADFTQVGDYLVGPRGVLFIVALPPLLRAVVRADQRGVRRAATGRGGDAGTERVWRGAGATAAAGADRVAGRVGLRQRGGARAIAG